MSRVHVFRCMALSVVLALQPAVSLAVSTARPNIVFFLVDDLGWADLGVTGSTFYETPNIDKLAARSLRFTNAYAACPVCSPTRASLLTGRHPVRVDITDWIPGHARAKFRKPRFEHVNDRNELALEEVTLAEALRDNGYQTAFLGKWHLGGEGFLPTDQGFDLNIGGFHVGSPPGGYYGPWKNPYLEAHHEGEYLTDRLTEESEAFIRKRDEQRPFLLYLSYYNVHTPIQADETTVEHFRAKAANLGPTPESIAERSSFTRMRQDNPDYASMVAAVDRSVGQILQTLDDLQLDDNTIVCFFSDNGGLATMPGIRMLAPTNNGPLRSGKGWLYEGGIREPMLIHVPGMSTAGTTCDEPVISMDFFPTLLDLAGLPLQPEDHIDGVTLRPLLEGTGVPDSRPFYWHYPHYHGSGWTPGAALRDGPWKLIEFYEYGDVELYNLESDPGEQNDLSDEMPQLTAKLREQLQAWQKNMSARMPVPATDSETTPGTSE